jgi:putative tricarboxylic transport membrane protein
MNNEPHITSPRSLLGPRITAGFVLALGLLVAYQTTLIRKGRGFTVVGPRVFPLLVAVGLIALGVIFLIRTTIRPDEDLAEQAASEESVTHWPTIGLIAAALVVYPFALSFLGYILGTTLFFPVVARILGSKRTIRDLIIGIVVSVVIYVAFTRFLGVRLPAGLLGVGVTR